MLPLNSAQLVTSVHKQVVRKLALKTITTQWKASLIVNLAQLAMLVKVLAQFFLLIALVVNTVSFMIQLTLTSLLMETQTFSIVQLVTITHSLTNNLWINVYHASQVTTV